MILMDLEHKPLCYSKFRYGVAIPVLYGLLLHATIARVASASESLSSNIRFDISSGRLEGSDLLGGVDGVYRQFKGASGPTNASTRENSQSSGSTLSIKDDDSELYFQLLYPRIETRIDLAYVVRESEALKLTTSMFIARSSVHYGFERGIGVLIDPAYLDYSETRLGIGFKLARVFRQYQSWEFSLAPLMEFNYQRSRTRLSSALIDVNISNSSFQATSGLEASAKPFKDIPFSVIAGIRRNTDRSTFISAQLQYKLAF